MAVASGRGRSWVRLGLLILTAVALMTLDFRGYGPLERIQIGLRDLLQPAVSAGNALVRGAGDVWTATLGGSSLRHANTELRAEIDRLEGAGMLAEADREAYKRLREATGVAYVEDIARLTASVLRDNVGNFRDDVFVIDKGRRDGLVSGMTVVTGAGLAGVVDAVGADQSTVIAVSSPDLGISVRLLDTGDVGLGHGLAGDHTGFVVDRGLRKPVGEQAGSLEDGQIGIGSVVVTAASSRYPADIPVGRVATAGSVEAGLPQTVMVELAVDTRDLRFVSVLLSEPLDEPPVGPDSPFAALSPTDGQPGSGRQPGGVGP